MSLIRNNASVFLSFSLSLWLWSTPTLAADITTQEITQEEFDRLKQKKSHELWNSEDMVKCSSYMRDNGFAPDDIGALRAYMQGAASNFWFDRINEAWLEFYATHKDPSGKIWSLNAGEVYDRDGNPR